MESGDESVIERTHTADVKQQPRLALPCKELFPGQRGSGGELRCEEVLEEELLEEVGVEESDLYTEGVEGVGESGRDSHV